MMVVGARTLSRRSQALQCAHPMEPRAPRLWTGDWGTKSPDRAEPEVAEQPCASA